jgi:hypothetical protein
MAAYPVGESRNVCLHCINEIIWTVISIDCWFFETFPTQFVNEIVIPLYLCAGFSGRYYGKKVIIKTIYILL